MNSYDWFSVGQENIWLPYTQMKNLIVPFKAKAAEGCYIILENGSELLDGISSWWSVCHGYNHPHIVKKMTEQLHKMSHVMFAGFAHEQAYILASRLAKFSPNSKLKKAFFSDSGSTAVEVAMKMAVQYYHNVGCFERSSFIFFCNSYHGDTMGCMSVSDCHGIHGNTFSKYMPRQYMMKIPGNEQEWQEFTNKVESLKDKIAGIIIEPILQAAGGMKIHNVETLNRIRQVAANNDILFIADEIATGFGRTGSMFACEQASIVPDIMTVGKGLTGGFCTLAATLTTQKVYDAFLSDSTNTAFMHGPTFMANPLACSAANASLDLFETEPRIQQVLNIELQLKSELDKFNSLSCVKDVRVKGAVGVIELNKKIRINNEKLLELGVWIRPIDNIVYLMPPFVITSDQLTKLTSSIYKLISCSC